MSFGSFGNFKDINNITKSFQDLGNQSFSFAKKTQRMVEERLGKATDVSQLPQEYIDLEQRVDSLKVVYQKLLDITNTYENESYDYPANMKESVNEFSKTFVSKVQDLSRATSASDAQAVLLSGGKQQPPKTLNHALGRAALSASQELKSTSDLNSATPSSSSLSEALSKYATAELKIGEARLTQDNLIRARFNLPMSKALKTSLSKATKARQTVEEKRLNYDAARAAIKTARPDQVAKLRSELDHLEDEFANATEEAVSIMKNVVDDSKPLAELSELIEAQLSYHKSAAELLGDLLPEINGLIEKDATRTSAFGDDI
ncbi:Gvp36 protein [Saccharomycopsis crataegensis]|uniref:Gvp36 protein n=1 Tax=Saccharomycopsis crataegensis TaxID=43959 RepID=A0AAV5QTW2_9ASCO|nr:Gvp36 protein [Saccharomycopsis crataegensis]